MLDSLNISLRKPEKLCIIHASFIGSASERAWNLAFELGFLYAPAVLIVDESWIEFKERAYRLAQQSNIENPADLEWMAQALSRFDEDSWKVKDNVLYSPAPSDLKERQVREIFRESRQSMAA
ncbi:MAG: hypothetical protein F6K19_46795 [Cyanothece sp. SIO1E1]|nr:hypothetical protein [Cyanothece sp. SIO1E1]